MADFQDDCLQDLTHKKLVARVKSITPNVAVSRLPKADLLAMLLHLRATGPPASSEFEDGRLQNFAPLSQKELAERVQRLTASAHVLWQSKAVLAQNLVNFHREHPRTGVLCRAPSISQEDKEELLSLLEGMSWHKYQVKKRVTEPTSQSRQVIQQHKSSARRATRDAAVGSQNFVLGITRGPVGSKGFERAGGQSKDYGKAGLGKNEKIVKRRQNCDYRACMALWRIMKKMLKDIDPDYTFTSIQVNRNFRGKPHVDRGDHSYQYALSLGDFRGGLLVIETDDPQQLAVLETKERLTKCDGRRPHWVTSYCGTRYSLIMYKNLGRRTRLLSNRAGDTNARPVSEA